MKKIFTFFVLLFMIIAILGCGDNSEDEQSEVDIFNEILGYSEQEIDYIESFAAQNNAVTLVNETNDERGGDYYSLELKKIFRINEQQNVAFPCYLIDINKIADKYFIVVEDNAFYFQTIIYQLECSEYIAEKLLRLHPDDHEDIIVIALLTDIKQPFLNLSPEGDGDDAYITIENLDNTFIAKGTCLAFEKLPNYEESKEETKK